MNHKLNMAVQLNTTYRQTANYRVWRQHFSLSYDVAEYLCLLMFPQCDAGDIR